jgi:hypothetical protein
MDQTDFNREAKDSTQNHVLAFSTTNNFNALLYSPSIAFRQLDILIPFCLCLLLDILVGSRHPKLTDL